MTRFSADRLASTPGYNISLQERGGLWRWTVTDWTGEPVDQGAVPSGDEALRRARNTLEALMTAAPDRPMGAPVDVVRQSAPGV